LHSSPSSFSAARSDRFRADWLGASTEWPGVVPADVEIDDLD